MRGESLEHSPHLGVKPPDKRRVLVCLGHKRDHSHNGRLVPALETRVTGFATRRELSRASSLFVDAIDLVSCKLDLIEQARLRRIPILTALGTGNKLDPTLLQVTDISKTSGCPLARVMRRELRARDIRRLKVVYSPEEPAETQQLEAPPPGRRSVPASVAWVPATAGLLMGSVVVRDLLHGGGMIP